MEASGLFSIIETLKKEKEDLNDLLRDVMKERYKMIELLNDARLQIEKETGSGNAVLARLSEYINLIL